MDHGAAAMSPRAHRGACQHLHHGHARDHLDVEAAHAEEGRHIENQGDHDDGAADPDQPRCEGADEAEADES